MIYEPIIGLEIHAELNTKTKMFCRSLNVPDEKHPNANICPVCMGHPGTLPVINREAVRKVIMVGLALEGEINKFSRFDRKNYFYPDLPKGYQISQYQFPLVEKASLTIWVPDEEKILQDREIRIRRVHLEEDTGKLIHDKDGKSSLVDFNRAGVPLMELVTEPDFRTGEELRIFGEEFQKILRYLNVSDADMEKGQMRVEVNMSLRPLGEKKFGTKVEMKNINSFKFAADAVEYEIHRQTDLLERGEKITHETRGWNEAKKETFSQRTKEEEHDYRYFPEPDLPPLEISSEFIEEIKNTLPELPEIKKKRFVREYALEKISASVLTKDKNLAEYYESVVSELRRGDRDTPEKPKMNLEKTAASFLTGELQFVLKEKSAVIKDLLIKPENMAELILLLSEGKISNLAAKQVLAEMASSGEDPSDLVEKLGLWQMNNAQDLEDVARHILKENSKAVSDYHQGKEASLQFLVGQVMKESRGKANPKIVRDILVKLLK